MCKNAKETQKHLFLDCSFANEVWCLVIKELHFNIILPTNWKDLFACWKDYYQCSLFKKPDFTRAWLALPKYVCWNIWIARNKGLFENLNYSPDRVSSSAKALWFEALLSNGLRHLHIEPLNSKEKSWTRDLLYHLKTSPTVVKKPNHTRWKIRKNP